MAAKTLNINVNIPYSKHVDMESLRSKLTVYAQILIDGSLPKAGKREPLSSLRGVLKTNSTDEELMASYGKAKYGL